ncbi:glycerophosphodiester phosphodiesterase family protein [Flavobacterium quisquiliarum]|uniref:Glycerophosphodiester phosphodiesterase family protein n=1 Tax=Flavobacterium quisquiliarum TaxID=1834436 RepID=A0ABV8W5R7_9FLAO|nr:glycerophosphodiester phosphodiesterase family protein [Flavobacterium quisquiliarum]MBW1655192.1 glycerophosphodiester phosphodiesterase [Flavobacterium quisquiliarum]NWL02785.1 glycerophosphodiester phosphodiesterase [Flavobacterium collinsii]
MLKFKKIICVLIAVAAIYSCGSQKTVTAKRTIEVQGHRGDRGNFPENSIPAFISAVKKGADVVELDVVISKDQKVVVSHEVFMSSQYMLDSEGKPIIKEKEKSYNLYEMTYDSIRKFDSGSRGNTAFPMQQKQKTYKPLLSEVIDSVEEYIAKNNLKPVRYNIEIKSEKSDYGKRQPEPGAFTDLVMKIIKDKGIERKINIQSFDPAVLNVMHKRYPKTKIAYLVGEGSVSKNLLLLDFKPEIYSPHYKLLNQKAVDSLRLLKMKIIPWTVNDDKAIDNMIQLQVDAIITDYPEKVLQKLTL